MRSFKFLVLDTYFLISWLGLLSSSHMSLYWNYGEQNSKNVVNGSSATPAGCMDGGPWTSLRKLTYAGKQQSVCQAPPSSVFFRLFRATPATCHKLDAFHIDITSNFYCHRFEVKQPHYYQTSLSCLRRPVNTGAYDVRKARGKKMKPGSEITIQMYTVPFFTLARGKPQITLSEKMKPNQLY